MSTVAQARRPTLRHNLRTMPGPAWVLVGGTFVNRFGSFVLPFLLLYLRHLGYSVPVAGLGVAAYGSGGLIASVVGGYLADRLRRRSVIALSMFSSAVVMLALSQMRALPLILIVAVCAGATAELYRPAASALLTDVVHEDARVTAFALLRFGINLGYGFGPAVAGFLADRSYTLLFLGDAATSVIFGVVALLALPRTHHAGLRRATGGTFRAVLQDRLFTVYLAVTLVAAFVFLQTGTTFALAVHDAGFSSATYGLLLSVNGLLIVFVELPLTSLTQRFPARPVIEVGMLFIGAGVLGISWALSFAALAVTVIVWTIGEMVSSPVGQAYVATLAPPHLRGRYNGLYGLMWAAASILGPALGALLYALAPHGVVLWTVCAALSAAAAAALVIVRRAPQARAVESSA